MLTFIYIIYVICVITNEYVAGQVKSPKSDAKIVNNLTGNWLRGVYIESQFEKTDKGRTDCGHLIYDHLDTALRATGLSKEQLFCSFDSDDYGILRPVDGKYCTDAINEDKDLYLKSAAKVREYLTKLFTDQVFNKNVPGGNLNTFTDLERYYLYRDAFTTFCTTGSAHYGGDTSSAGYAIYDKDPSSGKVAPAGYSVVSSRKNKKVMINNYIDSNGKEQWNETYTCDGIAKEILGNKDSAEVKALIGEMNEGVAESCADAYDGQIDSIRSWLNSNSSTLTTQQGTYIGTFVENHRSVAKSRKDSDGNTICNVDMLAKEWEEYKKDKGLSELSGIPELNGSYDPHTPVESTVDCSEVAGSLGWILCPTVDGMAQGTDGLYGHLAGYLNISPELFSADSKTSPTYQIWD